MIALIAPLIFTAAVAAIGVVAVTTLIPALPRIIDLLSRGTRR